MATSKPKTEVAKPDTNLEAVAKSLVQVSTNLSAAADAMLELAELQQEQKSRPVRLESVAIAGGHTAYIGKLHLAGGDVLTTGKAMDTGDVIDALTLVDGSVVVQRRGYPDLAIPLMSIRGMVFA